MKDWIDFLRCPELPMIGKLAYMANYFYSVLYIKATSTDKFYYRENSVIHKLLLKLYLY